MKKIHFIPLDDRKVTISHVSDVFSPYSNEYETVMNAIDAKIILPNHCSENSDNICRFLSKGGGNVKYVEGLAISKDGLHKIEHCWNYVDGKYFDVTLECFGDIGKYDYIAKRIFTAEEVSHFHDNSNMCMSFYGCPDDALKKWSRYDDKGRLFTRFITEEEKEMYMLKTTMIDRRVEEYLSAA